MFLNVFGKNMAVPSMPVTHGEKVNVWHIQKVGLQNVGILTDFSLLKALHSCLSSEAEKAQNVVDGKFGRLSLINVWRSFI